MAGSTHRVVEAGASRCSCGSEHLLSELLEHVPGMARIQRFDYYRHSNVGELIVLNRKILTLHQHKRQSLGGDTG